MGNQKGSGIVLIIILIFLIAVFGLYSGRLTQKKEPQKSAQTNDFLKRQVDLNRNFFQTVVYPEEVKNISEGELLGMRCTPTLICSSPYNDFCVYYPEGAGSSNAPLKIYDPRILALVREANNTIEKVPDLISGNVEEATICNTEDGREIIRYKKPGAGGGGGGMEYIGLVQPDKSVRKIASINEELAFFGCDQPLQLGKNNILYYQCRAGDGPTAAASIYKIDLLNQQSEVIFKCLSTLSEASGQEEIICR